MIRASATARWISARSSTTSSGPMSASTVLGLAAVVAFGWLVVRVVHAALAPALAPPIAFSAPLKRRRFRSECACRWPRRAPPAVVRRTRCSASRAVGSTALMRFSSWGSSSSGSSSGLWRLDVPQGYHFDEVYHARSAMEWLSDWEHGWTRDTYEWTHPMLAKYLIAAGIVAMDPNNVRDTTELGSPGPAVAVAPARTFQQHPRSVAFTVEGGQVVARDALDGSELSRWSAGGAVASLAWDLAGQRLLVGGAAGGTVQAYDLAGYLTQSGPRAPPPAGASWATDARQRRPARRVRRRGDDPCPRPRSHRAPRPGWHDDQRHRRAQDRWARVPPEGREHAAYARRPTSAPRHQHPRPHDPPPGLRQGAAAAELGADRPDHRPGVRCRHPDLGAGRATTGGPGRLPRDRRRHRGLRELTQHHRHDAAAGHATADRLGAGREHGLRHRRDR